MLRVRIATATAAFAAASILLAAPHLDTGDRRERRSVTIPAFAPAVVCVYETDPLTNETTMRCRPDFDPNGDGVVDPADLFYLVNFIYYDGPEPVGSGDANGDCAVDFADIVYLLNYLFYDGPMPAPCFS